MKSNPESFLFALDASISRPRRTSMGSTVNPERMPSESRFLRMSAAAGACFSMNTTSAAPRLSASIPIAPVPANRSAKRAPEIFGANTLNRVSRKRSLVGRSARPFKLFRMRLRYVPAMTRIEISPASADTRQVIAALPFCRQRAQDTLQRLFLRGIVGQGKGFAAGQFKQLSVAQRIGDVKAEVAGLASAEEFARSTKLQVSLGDFESVGSAHHGLEPHASFVRHARGRDQNTMRLIRAAANTPAKLMELREPEALRVFDDHYGGVRHVDADFHDRCRDENLRLILAKALHDFVFFVAGEPSMQQVHLQFWKRLFRKALVLFDRRFQFELRFFDDRIHDVALVPGRNFAAEKLPDAGEVRLRGHAC